jgi:hypothetical protein
MKNIVALKFALLVSLLVLSCASSAKKGDIAGGTSEETNALAYNGVSKITGLDGQSQTALYFQNLQSYAVSARDGAKFSATTAATAFEISAWVKIDSLPQKSEQLHNLIGKFTTDSSSLPAEFSLAVVNGACGTDKPSFAFFLTESNTISCEHAIVSKKIIQAGKWTFVGVRWNGRYLTLYQDGYATAEQERIFAVLPFSEAPVYFGKSKIPFAMDKLSLNTIDNKLSFNTGAQ